MTHKHEFHLEVPYEDGRVRDPNIDEGKLRMRRREVITEDEVDYDVTEDVGKVINEYLLTVAEDNNDDSLDWQPHPVGEVVNLNVTKDNYVLVVYENGISAVELDVTVEVDAVRPAKETEDVA